MIWLVVWNMKFILPYIHNYVYIYIYIGVFIIPTDDLIFFRGVAQPPPSDSADSNGSPGAGHGTQGIHGARYRKKSATEDGCQGFPKRDPVD